MGHATITYECGGVNLRVEGSGWRWDAYKAPEQVEDWTSADALKFADHELASDGMARIGPWKWKSCGWFGWEAEVDSRCL